MPTPRKARATTSARSKPVPRAKAKGQPRSAPAAAPAKAVPRDGPLVEFSELPPPRPVTAPAPIAGELAISTRGLTKQYGERRSVDGLDLRVPRGKVVGFVGPNGAGKTTTIRMLLGLIEPTSGEAEVLGVSTRHPTKYLPRVGALIESPAFYPNLTGAANLKVFCRMGGYSLDRIPVLLQQVGLGDRGDEPYKRYSLGMKQRLGIAAALLPDPDLLILDEPTNGLDPAGIHEVRDFLRSLGDQGKTVFVSSHLLSEIQKMCDYVVMLRQGRLLFQGTLDELALRGSVLHLVPEKDADAGRLADLCRTAGYEVEMDAGHIDIRAAPPEAGAAINRAAMAAGITLREISGGSGDLESTFLAMTGEGEL